MTGVELPRLDSLSRFEDRWHDIRFHCRTSFHVPATDDLTRVCAPCAALWWEVFDDLATYVRQVETGQRP